MVNRESFYLSTQPLPEQKEGFEAIFNYWDDNGLYDGRQLAYAISTVWHESAHTMQPIEEYGKGKGKEYGKPYPGTGLIYFGRGLVQLTWFRNYMIMGERLGIDLVHHPELALQMEISVKILFEGMIHGLFTGKKLDDYFNDEIEDPYHARRIINGLDQADRIATHYHRFLKALFI